MLVKYLPILITGASLFIAIAIHWRYKTSLLFPSLLAAVCTTIVSFIGFRMIASSDVIEQSTSTQFLWNAAIFAFVSGFVLALLIGYLMKYAPNLFGK